MASAAAQLKALHEKLELESGAYRDIVNGELRRGILTCVGSGRHLAKAPIDGDASPDILFRRH